MKNSASPPEPAPAAVRLQSRRHRGIDYPANGCTLCGATIGDFSLTDLLLDSLPYGDTGDLADRFLNDFEPPE